MVSRRAISTNRVLKRYLEEIQSTELLEPNEEILLARRIRQGDQEALNRMLTSNLRFVVSVAKRYQNQGLSLEDLISEGNLGLIKAAVRFDETRGFKFISYAVWWIRQSILEAISQKSRLVRLPMNRVDNILRFRKACEELQHYYEREPTTDEVARELDIPKTAVAETKMDAEEEMSVDAPRINSDDVTLLKILPVKERDAAEMELDRLSMHSDIERALETLTDREAEIIRLYYGLNGEYPMTLGKIGEKYHLTRERIRQIKATGLEKLRSTNTASALRKYLGQETI